MQRLAGFLSVLVLAGCATLSQEDCLRGDWFGVGMKDGLAGEPESLLSEHAKACYEYGIVVENQTYFAGREQGLRDYCRLENAFAVGLNGRPYHHVCPGPIDGLFGHFHAAAYAVYVAHSEMERIENELYSKERQLHDKKLNDKDRAQIREDIRHMDRQRDYIRDDLYHHERQLDRLRYEAQAYR